MIPISIVDNFLETPDQVREFALSLSYENSEGHFPGKRSTRIDLADASFEKIISEKMFSLFFDLFKQQLTWKIEGSFQLISQDYEEGWVHNDISPDNWNIAGIIYLNPTPAVNSGTSFFKLKPDIDLKKINLEEYNNFKHQFYSGSQIDLSQYREKRDHLNSLFTKTLTAENIYNRLVVYDTNELHRADKFFGTTKDDSRLTFVFHARIETDEQTPLQRSKQFII